MSRQFWIMGLLAVSLLVNALVIGIIIGRSQVPEPGPVPGEERTLPDQRPTSATRRFLRDASREVRREIEPLRAAERRASVELRQAFSASPYDHERMVTALKAFQDAQAALRTETQNALLARIENASPEERRALIWLALRGDQSRGHRGNRRSRRDRMEGPRDRGGPRQ